MDTLFQRNRRFKESPPAQKGLSMGQPFFQGCIHLMSGSRPCLTAESIFGDLFPSPGIDSRESVSGEIRKGSREPVWLRKHPYYLIWTWRSELLLPVQYCIF